MPGGYAVCGITRQLESPRLIGAKPISWLHVQISLITIARTEPLTLDRLGMLGLPRY